MKAIGYRILTGICVLLMLLPFCVAMPADAAENTATLTLHCVKDDEIIVGMYWQIFRVGHREQNDYVFEGDFAGCRPTLGNQTKPMAEWPAETVSAAAETLRIEARLDKIQNRGEGYTDTQGILQFSGLEDGLYLVIGTPLQQGIKTYIPSAIFFEVNSEQENVLNAFPKIIYVTLSNQTERYSVTKVWKNNENQPRDVNAYITCEIYCDDVLYDTVRLDQSNNWTYQWSDKDGHEWLVREKEIPENYTVSYTNNHYQYLIVNTYETPPAETTVTVTQTTAAPPPGGSKLPQTGQLWWPVPALALGGMVFLSAGWKLKKKDEDE